MKQSFFFYDLETSGLMPREDRIMQFAGQRVSMDLQPVGEPVNVLIKMTDDALPSPGAIKVTGITPQQTLMDGLAKRSFANLRMKRFLCPERLRWVIIRCDLMMNLCGRVCGEIFMIRMSGRERGAEPMGHARCGAIDAGFAPRGD